MAARPSLFDVQQIPIDFDHVYDTPSWYPAAKRRSSEVWRAS